MLGPRALPFPWPSGEQRPGDTKAGNQAPSREHWAFLQRRRSEGRGAPKAIEPHGACPLLWNSEHTGQKPGQLPRYHAQPQSCVASRQGGSGTDSPLARQVLVHVMTSEPTASETKAGDYSSCARIQRTAARTSSTTMSAGSVGSLLSPAQRPDRVRQLLHRPLPAPRAPRISVSGLSPTI